jgi:hypothetical protein
MKKCRECGQDVYVTPKGKDLPLCATHALVALALFLYPRKAKAILAKQPKPNAAAPKTKQARIAVRRFPADNE